MKFFTLCVILAASLVPALGQQQAMQPAEALNKLSFLQGEWSGKQVFNTNGGPAMVGDATDRVEVGIAGKYLCEMLSTTLPSRQAHRHAPLHPRIRASRPLESTRPGWFNDLAIPTIRPL